MGGLTPGLVGSAPLGSIYPKGALPMVYTATAASEFGSDASESVEQVSEASTAQLTLVSSSKPRSRTERATATHAVRRPSLRVLVGVQDEGFNGIETYAEQVALAGMSAGHEVTLLVTTDQVAELVRTRTAGSGLEVVSAGLTAPTKSRLLAQRLLPQLHTQRVGEALKRVLRSASVAYDVVHLNRPALAPWVEGRAQLFVAGWYYPHAPVERLTETWNHTQGRLPRRIVLAAKAMAYYAGDAQGYRASTVVVACTETLAAQLRSQGLRAVACPPPVQASPEPLDAQAEPLAAEDGELRLLLCCGDLSHPRKNVAQALRATALLAHAERSVVLRVIGANSAALDAELAALPRGVRVEFLGTKSPREVREEMRRAHVFLLPSLYEEWGYVAVESILSGTPVVTNPVYPFADMLAGGLGVVAQEISASAFADAIERALSLVRGRQLAEAGERRFGATAIGSRLANVWSAPEQAADPVFAALPAFA
jgi:glycosyltransferase involved in cell wall biosynthesis